MINWKDKRNVMTLSSIPEHHGNLVATGKKTRGGEDIMKPISVIDYNFAKKGVDLSDQFSSYYTPLRKTKKWYRKLAIELLLGTTVVNSWLIFNKYYSSGKKWKLVKFRESLVLSFLTGTPKEDIKPGKRRSQVKGTPSLCHCLAEAPGPKRKSRKRCVGCYEIISANEGSRMADKKARKVSTFCEGCSDKPFLCLSCFKIKHNF